jgi:valyl-tRNA synthetase
MGPPPTTAGDDESGMPAEDDELKKQSASTSRCKPIASVEPPTKCAGCGSSELVQDSDVLDTWFSSALWPFSVFHWPEQTEDLKTFYPTSVLVTGHEILYLWVARMVMMGLEFQNEVPFRDVYIHGIVRDKQGKKMSKSLGNVIDPLDVMKKFGTDALRFSLAESSIPGRDMHLSDESFLKARNFANKLWNASRFVLMRLGGFSAQPLPAKNELAFEDRWILDELQKTIDDVSQALASYNTAEAARVLYAFVWGSFCDWYVEVSKVQLMGPDGRAKEIKQSMLVHVLETCLRLLHPFMPFETEQLYQSLKSVLSVPQESVMICPWPQADPAWKDASAAQLMRRVQDLTTAIRTVRSEMTIPPGKPVRCGVNSEEAAWKGLLSDPAVLTVIESLAAIEPGQLRMAGSRPENSAVAIFDGGEAYIPIGDLVDRTKEKARLEKNRQQLMEMIARGKVALENKNFIERAPKEEVENRRETLRVLEQKIRWIDRNLEGLS